MRFWRELALGAQSFDVEFHGATHLPLHLPASGARSDTTRKIGSVGRVTRRGLLDNDENLHGFSPACFRMLFTVPADKLSLAFPATVTITRFAGCLNCRWLPLVRSRYHPSFRRSRSTSRIFAGIARTSREPQTCR